ncbi:DNA-binding transcriptional response regulator, NtrC family, contains REC, AAA-type ATPase, and a Fis-type DNA-binding domains [Catalinimonas alkaloidigena]|uniref:DNA-binding transcriptional regulator NtrC n=1 Tax=Catalinimonas alkaloidigena TaxID=1075417 RepID=A0A1G9FE31_9BACT|nr:sigma-54 dependent transcriptional regulator [Catalinimonas alkaloidigena]SDK86629.1 DNA-binding transcriptional response regulator, NtrC family, contains REC, AAA-type ATPase, and a Fis-type DNA-binding domains [Catalinimonas alkaloidigena]
MEKRNRTQVFIVDDDPITLQLSRYRLEKEQAYEVTTFTNAEDFLMRLEDNPDIVVLDYRLPNTNGLEILRKINAASEHISCVVMSGQESAEVVVEAYKHGAKNYIIKGEQAFDELAACLQQLNTQYKLRRDLDRLREQVLDRERYWRIVGESPATLQVLRLIQKVERTELLVLITGESGTGKELVARAIHYNSPRKRKPFVAINVGAIPEDLIENELFGHEKGAFTGALSRRIGKFEEANGGTIFLDEIGEMDLAMQTKLLRILQERVVTRLGSNKEIKLDIRILAATNRNLAELVRQGKFREDLYYRLQGFLIHLPALRERDNDVIMLAKHFVKTACEKAGIPLKSFTPDVVRQMMQHPWPGNIRELQSVVERAVLLSDGPKITEEDLIFAPVV